MKKALKIAALGAGVVLLAGCGNGISNNNQNQNTGETRNQEREQEREGNGMISSIKDAMGLGKTMRCTYKIESENGEMEMVSYVKGQNYMTESNVGGSLQKSVFNDEGMYSWSEKDKQGTKMSKKCMEELERSVPEDQSEDDNAPEIAEIDPEEAFTDAMDVKCEGAEADFSIPKDVNFVDQCEMMKKMMNSVNEMKNRLPGGGAGMPQMPNLEGTE